MSLGTSPNPLIKSTTKGLEINKKGGIIVNEDGLTSRESVYAGGDADGCPPPSAVRGNSDEVSRQDAGGALAGVLFGYGLTSLLLLSAGWVFLQGYAFGQTL